MTLDENSSNAVPVLYAEARIFNVPRQIGNITNLKIGNTPSSLSCDEISEIYQPPRRSEHAASLAKKIVMTRLFRDLVLKFGQNDREIFIVATLTHHNTVNGLTILGVGDKTSVLCSPSLIAKIAIMQDSSRIIVAHNHPSARVFKEKGKITHTVGFQPSKEDINLTARLLMCCINFDIELVDHLIFGEIDPKHEGTKRRQPYVSFHENGLFTAIQNELGRKRLSNIYHDWSDPARSSKQKDHDPLKIKINFA